MVISKGIRVVKKNTSEVLAILRDNQIIDSELRILKLEEHCVIPISGELNHNLLVKYEFELCQMDFERNKSRDRSLRDNLQGKIPEELEEFIPVAYEVIGSIAVVDLHDMMIPYREQVGDAILGLSPSISTVYQKTGKVAGTYRLRVLELIAGEDESVTVHREFGIRLKVDVKRVYFSPRLSTEHNRIASIITEGDRVLDMFCGIAPFAFHILSRVKAEVVCVDINPGVKPLIDDSIQLNKLVISPVILVGDIREVVDSGNIIAGFDHIIMNHPSSAIDYLDLAIELLEPRGFIHLYCFAPTRDLDEYIENLLGSYGVMIEKIHVVRRSSPSEAHVCVQLKKL